MAPKLSVFVTEVRDPREAVVATVAAERLGFHGAWFPSTMASDALTLAALSAGSGLAQRMCRGYLWCLGGSGRLVGFAADP